MRLHRITFKPDHTIADRYHVANAVKAAGGVIRGTMHYGATWKIDWPDAWADWHEGGFA